MSLWGDITGALGGAANWVGNEFNQGVQGVEHLFGGGGQAPQQQAPTQSPAPVRPAGQGGFYPSIQDQLASTQQQAQQQQQQLQQQQQQNNSKKKPKESIAQSLLDAGKTAEDAGNQFLHGLGDTAAGAVGGLVQLGGRLSDPILPGNQTAQADQLAQTVRQDAAESTTAPNTNAGDAGYIAGNVAGMLAQAIPAVRGEALGSDIASFLKDGSNAPQAVQNFATRGLQAVGGGLGYTAVSGDTSPQSAAQNIALGAGIAHVPDAINAVANVVTPINDATRTNLARTVQNTPENPQTPMSQNVRPPVAPNAAPAVQSVLQHYDVPNPTPGQTTALNHFLGDPQGILNAYDQRVQQEFGTTNVAAADEAKHVIPGFDDNPEQNSVDYHELSSAIAKAKLQQLLSDPATKGQPVLLMSGGTGAGKTSTLRATKDLSRYAAVVDTNLNDFNGAQDRIHAALGTGRPVEISYVYRDPVEAFKNGVIPRAKDEGRIVPISGHIDTHLGSRSNMVKLADTYAGDNRVSFDVLDNSRGHGNQVQVSLDELPKMKYNEVTLRQELERIAHEEHQKGNVTGHQLSSYLGGGVPEDVPGNAAGSPASQPAPGSTESLNAAPGQPDQVPNQAQVTSPTEVGISSFRGTPVSKVEDTQPYFNSPRAKGFANSLTSRASDYGLQLQNLNRTAGVWEGSLEPSFKDTVSGDPDAIRAYAAEHGLKANQDAVALFTPGKDGDSTKYVFSNVKNPNQFVRQLTKHGIQGATVTGDGVEVVDFGNGLGDNIAKLSDTSGIRPQAIRGNAELLEKEEGDYNAAIQKHAANQNGSDLHPEAQPAAKGGVEASQGPAPGPAQLPETEGVRRLQQELDANASAEHTDPATMEELEGVIKKHRDLMQSTTVSPEMKAATQQAIDRETAIREDPRQQTNNKVELKADNAKSVIAETEGIRNERLNRFNKAVLHGLKLTKEQLVKLDDALRGKETGDAKVDAVAAKLHDAYDYSLAADRAAGGRTMRYNEGKYSPLYFKADKAKMDELGIPEGIRVRDNAGDYTGFKDQSRYYRSYEEAAQRDGLERLNDNALQDAIMYATQGDHAITHNMLYRGLKRVAPDEVASERGYNGNEQLTPAAKGNLPFYATKRMNKVLVNYKSSELDHPIAETALKVTETGAKATRKVSFLLAPVHYFNVGTNYMGEMLTNLHPIKMFTDPMRAALGATSDRFYQAELERADKAGIREWNRRNGVVERSTQPDALHNSGISLKIQQKSIFARSMRAMSRFTNILSWKLGELAQKSGVEAGTKEGVAVGAELNKVLDVLNSRVEGFNPVGERLATSGSLAPHWIRSQVALVKDALTKGGHPTGMDTPGGIARSAVVGKRALEASAAIIGSAIVTGQMPSFHQALSEAGLLPSNPIPNLQTGDKNTKGKPVVTNMPTDMIGLVAQLLTDPTHFGIARETPVLSAVTQAITNKDWTGNQLVDKTQPGWQIKMAEKVGQGLLPFLAQNALNPNLTIPQMAEAAIGMRTHRDPNDPQYKAAVQYATGSQNVINSLSGRDQDAARTYYDRTRDPDGAAYNLGPKGSQLAAKALLGMSDNALQKVQDQEKKQPNHSAEFDLPLDQLRTFENYKSQIKDSGDQLVIKMNNPWISNVEAADSQKFQQLQASGQLSQKNPDPNDPPVNYPLSQQEGALMAQAGKITDPQAKTQFYADHPELLDIEQRYGQYANAVRKAQGAQPIPITAPPDAQTAADLKAYNALPQHDGPKGGNKTRAIFLSGHPNVTSYFTQSAYNSLLRLAGIADANNGNAGDKQQQLLKDIKNVGSMDIGTNSSGQLVLGGTPDFTSSGSGTTRFKYASKKSGGGKSSSISLHIRPPSMKLSFKSKPHIQTAHIKAPYIKAAKNTISSRVPGTSGGPKIPIELKGSTKA